MSQSDPSPGFFRSLLTFLEASFRDFLEDDCPRMAAALSYYTIFSLPGLLILVIALAGAVWGAEAVEGTLEREMEGLLGQRGAQQVATMIESAGPSGEQSGLSRVVGLLVLIFGATGAFAQLQGALNRAWEVEPDPEQGGLKNFLLKRVLSFGMILAVAFLLLVSLVLSAVLGALGERAETLLGTDIPVELLRATNAGVSFLVIAVLFAALFKLLPDARVRLRDTAVGALLTAGLFVLGKFVIGLYLGHSEVGSAYGAAGSLAVLLVWVYYASMILLLGAEMTQVWARRYGEEIVPEEGALRVVERRERRGRRPEKNGST